MKSPRRGDRRRTKRYFVWLERVCASIRIDSSHGNEKTPHMHAGLQVYPVSTFDQAAFAFGICKCGFTWATTASNVVGSVMANSLSIFRLSVIPAAVIALMKRL